MRPASSSSAAPPRDAAQLVLEAIREMIYQGRLSPGQQLRQEELAIALGVSRNPVREALKGLQAERFVGHSLNQGYFVTRFSAAELQQIYLMRQLVETQVLLSLPPFSRSDVQVLVKLNGALGVAAEAPSVSEMIRINREFHFAIFNHSPFAFLVQELTRLWRLSELYRSLYLVAEPARRRIVEEHREIIDAISRHDVVRVIEISDKHREVAEEVVFALVKDR
ncbi:MAG: GntR family transcriptional regulator [Candidatus Acidiferrales bacterium]